MTDTGIEKDLRRGGVVRIIFHKKKKKYLFHATTKSYDSNKKSLFESDLETIFGESRARIRQTSHPWESLRRAIHI